MAHHARFIDLRFWKRDNRIEIPIEITRIICLDPPTIRTADGTVHVTPSDADLIASKVIGSAVLFAATRRAGMDRSRGWMSKAS